MTIEWSLSEVVPIIMSKGDIRNSSLNRSVLLLANGMNVFENARKI